MSESYDLVLSGLVSTSQVSHQVATRILRPKSGRQFSDHYTVLHINIPLNSEETTSVPDQSGGQEDVGRDGTPDDAKTWQDADPLSSWDNYGLDRSPSGFVLNKGANFINFQVLLPGRKTMQALYINIEWTDDPIVYGKLEGDPHTYFEYIHTTPYYSDNQV